MASWPTTVSTRWESSTLRSRLKDCEDKTKETNCKVVGQARGTATPGVPSGQTRFFNTSDLRFDNLPREVQVQCGTQPCNAGRVFNWRVIPPLLTFDLGNP